MTSSSKPVKRPVRCVVGNGGALPPPLDAVSRYRRGGSASRGIPKPHPSLSPPLPEDFSLRPVQHYGVLLRYCGPFSSRSAVRRRAPAAGASRKGERSQAEETRAHTQRRRVFRSLVENGRFWRLGFSCFRPMQTVHIVRRQSIPPPLRATMLRLLRLPFPASCASRIPEIPPGAALC